MSQFVGSCRAIFCATDIDICCWLCNRRESSTSTFIDKVPKVEQIQTILLKGDIGLACKSINCIDAKANASVLEKIITLANVISDLFVGHSTSAIDLLNINGEVVFMDGSPCGIFCRTISAKHWEI
jgi:hypothetical protein